MLVSKFLNKQISAAEAEVIKITGSVDTVLITLHNQDASNTLTYKFQDSDDGITWDDISLAVAGGGTSIQFLLAATEEHHVKLTTARPRLRLMASGDLHAGIGLQYSVDSPTDETGYEIFPT